MTSAVDTVPCAGFSSDIIAMGDLASRIIEVYIYIYIPESLTQQNKENRHQARDLKSREPNNPFQVFNLGRVNDLSSRMIDDRLEFSNITGTVPDRTAHQTSVPPNILQTWRHLTSPRSRLGIK